MKIINNPGGGQIVFGPFDGEGTAQQAMGEMLKSIHGHFGAKPQLGRFFRDKSGSTVAAFFNLTAKTGGKGPVSGLVVVSAPSPSQRSAAVVYDGTDRFRKTLSPMLKRLNEEWMPAGATPEQKGAGRAEPLQTVQFPDGSGQVGLPIGWKVLLAHGGTVHAAGPHGEKVIFGDAANCQDPSTPAGRQMANFLTNNGRRIANGIYVAVRTDDPAKSFISIKHQAAQMQHLPLQSIRILSETPLDPRQPGGAIHLVGELDAHDGMGLMSMTANIRMMVLSKSSWSMLIYQTNVPQALAESERATMLAISKSYKVNSQVVNAEDAAFVASIHATAAANKKRTEAARDDSARGAQGFCNYIRDEAVIEDTQTGAHATGGYDITDQIVKSNPDRFQYVPISNYLKGIDY